MTPSTVSPPQNIAYALTRREPTTRLVRAIAAIWETHRRHVAVLWNEYRSDIWNTALLGVGVAGMLTLPLEATA